MNERKRCDKKRRVKRLVGADHDEKVMTIALFPEIRREPRRYEVDPEMSDGIEERKLPSEQEHDRRVSAYVRKEPLIRGALVRCHLVGLKHEVGDEVEPDYEIDHFFIPFSIS
jgi:hypothetical protein